jgi:hypothetical protein
VRGVGLFDRLRGKPDEDPILGGRGAEPSGLEVGPAEGATWTHAVHPGVGGAPGEPGGPPVDPAALMRTVQDAGGDPEKLLAQLRELFPGAQIDVDQTTIGAASHPEVAQASQAFFGGDAPGAGPAADPIAQIERLAALHRSGALTDAEFAAAKAKLLGS